MAKENCEDREGPRVVHPYDSLGRGCGSLAPGGEGRIGHNASLLERQCDECNSAVGYGNRSVRVQQVRRGEGCSSSQRRGGMLFPADDGVHGQRAALEQVGMPVTFTGRSGQH